jgi:hypothetical protein
MTHADESQPDILCGYPVRSHLHIMLNQVLHGVLKELVTRYPKEASSLFLRILPKGTFFLYIM